MMRYAVVSLGLSIFVMSYQCAADSLEERYSSSAAANKHSSEQQILEPADEPSRQLADNDNDISARTWSELWE